MHMAGTHLWIAAGETLQDAVNAAHQEFKLPANLILVCLPTTGAPPWRMCQMHGSRFFFAVVHILWRFTCQSGPLQMLASHSSNAHDHTRACNRLENPNTLHEILF